MLANFGRWNRLINCFVRNKASSFNGWSALFAFGEVYGLLQASIIYMTSIKSAEKINKVGRLRICHNFWPVLPILPRAHRGVYDQYPGVEVKLTPLACTEIRQGIASGQYQIGLVDKAQKLIKHDSELYLACIVPLLKPPAAQLDVITPHDLQGLNWVTLDSRKCHHETLKRNLCWHRPAIFNRTLEVHTTTTSFICYFRHGRNTGRYFWNCRFLLDKVFQWTQCRPWNLFANIIRNARSSTV